MAIKNIKIYQMAPNFVFGDAIGNEIIMLNKLIGKLGYKTNIYYDEYASPDASKISYHYTEIKNLGENDILIYHMSTKSKITYFFGNSKCKKILIYHNITPPEYFEKYDKTLYSYCKEGLEEVRYLSDKTDYCLADSEYNKNDLVNMGYKCKIDVLPILLSYDDYKKRPSKKIIKMYKDKKTNIISVGRINAPNKKWENVIKTFYMYNKYIDSEARLFLIGSSLDENLYFQKLGKYIKELALNNVVFTGHIPFNELLAYYRIADIYLCMSEHEGFCVPLLEAMLFNIPVIAYSTTAIPYTLDGAGFLLENNNPLEAAMVIERVIKDKVLRNEIIKNQKTRLNYFSTDKISKLFIKYLNDFIKLHIENNNI